MATTRKTSRNIKSSRGKARSKGLTNEKRKRGGYKTTLEHREAVEKYDKKNTQSIRLKLNDKTDKDILSMLNKSGNKQGLIKNALRSYKGKVATPKSNAPKSSKAKEKTNDSSSKQSKSAKSTKRSQ